MKIKGYPLNKKKSYCISEVDSYLPIIYQGTKQYFRLKGAAVEQLKKIERDMGHYFEIRTLILNRDIMEDKN
jgi:hypothetical protein